jgi:hypothetical protein
LGWDEPPEDSAPSAADPSAALALDRVDVEDVRAFFRRLGFGESLAESVSATAEVDFAIVLS